MVRHEQLGFRTLALTTVLSLLIGAFSIWQLVLILRQLQIAS
jgi:hypothetical protein